jgi:serine O-acetyltransferase
VIVNSRARVGANAVVTKDVPEGAVMVGIPARSTLLDATEYARDFVPYGTPCNEAFDPATQKLEILQCQLEVLQKQLKTLLDERAASGEGDDAPRRKGGRKSA